MGTRRPPLPAPTDISSSGFDTTDDLATELSRVTDKTSYSIPEDGSPVTITTKKIKGGREQSQTSLLIEYFEGSTTSSGGAEKRPSVRVRVTPSASKKGRSKDKGKGHIQITGETGRSRKPSYTRRISLPQSSDEGLVASEGSDISSGRPPVEVEVLQNNSDLSQRSHSPSRLMVAGSDISSMPPDSMLGSSVPAFASPRGPSSNKLDAYVPESRYERDRTVQVNTLTLPATESRDRSVSRERLAQSAMKKIQERNAASRGSSSKEKALSQRSSRSSARGDYVIDEQQSVTESPKIRGMKERLGNYLEPSEISALSTGSAGKSSVRSGHSAASSINNPKLLSAVEDAIKRLILPELNAVKEEQSRQKNRIKFDEITRDGMAPVGSRENLTSSRRVSKSSSSPNVSGRPTVVVDEVSDSVRSKKSRRSSRASDESHETAFREKGSSRRSSREKRSSSGSKAAAAAGAAIAGGLTAAALRHHDSIQSLNEESERRERRKTRRSKSRSRSASISESLNEHTKETTTTTTRGGLGIPPLPTMQQGSAVGTDITRDSILSADTDRPYSESESFTETRKHEVKEVSRGSPRQLTSPSPGPRTPTRTPDRLAREAGSPLSIRSDRNLEVAQHDRVQRLRSGESLSRSPKIRKHRSNLSVESVESSPTTDMHFKPRPQGISLEGPNEILPSDHLGSPISPGGAIGVDEDWFAREHEENERLRREYEAESQLGSSLLDANDESFSTARDVRDVNGANPEYVHTPVAVESAVASLHEPSLLSSVHSGGTAKTDSVHESYGLGLDGNVNGTRDLGGHHLQQSGGSSKERWEAIRDQALANARQNGASTVSPRQSDASFGEPPVLGASAVPLADEPMPEIGHYDDEDDVITNPSIIKGPIGGTSHGDRSHWPYEATPALGDETREEHKDHTARNVALGLGAGAAAVGLGLAGSRSRESNRSATDQRRHVGIEDVADEYHATEERAIPDVSNNHQQFGYASPSGGRGIDEGYMSGAVPGGELTPDPYTRDRGYDEASLDDIEGDDPFTSSKRLRYASGLSHGMASPLYDAAMGKGIDRIKDRDVVALMDHLTVRDAQRNARDTEILTTLVRNGADLRNQWEDMKKFIQEQDRMLMAHNERAHDKTVQRVIGGPRPFPGAAAKRIGSDDTDESEKAKKSLFRRAFKSLGSKNQDLSNIESMLMQLLQEVEELKAAQIAGTGSQRVGEGSRSNSLGSNRTYDDLRTVQDPGYEPEGIAGTSSSPAQSGHLSNPSSKQITAMHSGYDARRSSEGHRISTVIEGDEEAEAEDWTPQSAPAREREYINNDGMLTPTQEVRRGHSVPLAAEVTPPEQRQSQQPRSAEETPRTDKSKKHKSGASSIWSGIPKISRWSKTTASSVPEQQIPVGAKGRPYSQMSRSGSNLHLDEYDEYDLHEDDRLRSRTSLDQQQQRGRDTPRSGRSTPSRRNRSPGPLIPEERQSIEDPKYHVHRNSLNLQHPQPRAGPTHRHQYNLEDQAVDYQHTGTPGGGSEVDQWGTTPALALNRLNRFSGSSGQAPSAQQNLSPVHSEDGDWDGYSDHSASEQAHNRLPSSLQTGQPTRRSDEGPLVPPKVPFDDDVIKPQQPIDFGYHSPYSNSGMHIASPLEPIEEVRYSLETDRSSVARREEMTPSPRPTAMQSVQRKMTGPREMPARKGSNGNTLAVPRKPVAVAGDQQREKSPGES